MPTKKTTVNVCVIMPALNEESVIGKVIRSAFLAFKDTPYNATVVVINDASKDATSANAQKAGAEVIDQLIWTGAGGATATGLSYAKQNGFDIAVTMDSDGQHDANDVVKGVNQLVKSGSDLLIGSRLIDSHGMSRIKILGNKGLSFITWVIFGIRSTDSQSGLRVFSRDALDRLYWKAAGYEFASEMLWRAHQQGLKTGEFSIKAIYTDYSKAKGQSNWNAINIIKSLVRQRLAEVFE